MLNSTKFFAMKKLLLFSCLSALFAMASACSDNNEDPLSPSRKNPEVTVVQLSVSEYSVSFRISSSDLDSGAFRCLPAAGDAPTDAEILAAGEPFEVNGEATYTVSDLAPETDYILYAVGACGETTVCGSFAFTTPKHYYENIEADQACCFYFGDYVGDGSGCYYLVLSTAGITSDGLPEKAGHMLRLFLNAEKSADSNNAVLAPGEYLLSDDFGEFTFNTEMSHYIRAYETEDGLDGPLYEFAEGVVRIASAGNGSYTVEAVLALDTTDGEPIDDESNEVHCTFSGNIAFVNFDSESYVPLTEDYSFEATSMTGNYTKGNYSIVFYNVLLDDDGFIIGGGDLLNLELFTEATAAMDPSVLPGTYELTTMESGNYAPYSFMEGIFYEYYGMYMPIGTYYALYDDSGWWSKLGLATGGTITVSHAGGDDYTFEVDLLVEKGVRVRMTYTGSVVGNVLDYSSYYSTMGVQAPKGVHAPLLTAARRLPVSGAWSGLTRR